MISYWQSGTPAWTSERNYRKDVLVNWTWKYSKFNEECWNEILWKQMNIAKPHVKSWHNQYTQLIPRWSPWKQKTQQNSKYNQNKWLQVYIATQTTPIHVEKPIVCSVVVFLLPHVVCQDILEWNTDSWEFHVNIVIKILAEEINIQYI